MVTLAYGVARMMAIRGEKACSKVAIRYVSGMKKA